jgi:dTDP-L-rhamnose 4-epimerase
VGTILVTGGLGFIGSHIVDQLVARGEHVRCLDSLDPMAHDEPPAYANPGAEHLRIDIRDADALEAAVQGVDAVSHQAAMVGLGVDLGDIDRYVSHNDLGTALLVRALYRGGFRGRLVLASSMAVYGEGRYRCATHGLQRPAPRRVELLEAGQYEPTCPRCDRALAPEAVPEDSPPDPRNVYAATKLHQEHLCQALAREQGSSAIALRYHNVYGPRMPRDTPYAGVASIFRSALEAGAAPRVLEDGGQLRDFVHVEDVARANVLALDAPAEISGPFNVASGTPRSVGDLARALATAMQGPAPEVVGGYRLGDVRHVFASAQRAADVLGFRAGTDFAEGVGGFARAPLRAPARHAEVRAA